MVKFQKFRLTGLTAFQPNLSSLLVFVGVHCRLCEVFVTVKSCYVMEKNLCSKFNFCGEFSVSSSFAGTELI